MVRLAAGALQQGVHGIGRRNAPPSGFARQPHLQLEPAKTCALLL